MKLPIFQIDPFMTRAFARIRDAVAEYLPHRRPEQPDDAFGAWSERKIDGMTYQEKLRAEW